MECRRFRSALTSYVDNEMPTGERLRIEEHLERCASCRQRVSRENAVRQRLGRWSAEMKRGEAGMAAAPAFEAPLGGPRRTIVRVAAITATAATVLGLVMMSGRWTGDSGRVFAASGLITDNRCAGGHTHTTAALKDMSGRDCVRRCVEMGAAYVFVANGAVYPIRNQDLPDLTEVAGQDVQLEGEVRENVLTVSRVRVLTAARSSDARRRWTRTS